MSQTGDGVNVRSCRPLTFKQERELSSSPSLFEGEDLTTSITAFTKSSIKEDTNVSIPSVSLFDDSFSSLMNL